METLIGEKIGAWGVGKGYRREQRKGKGETNIIAFQHANQTIIIGFHRHRKQRFEGIIFCAQDVDDFFGRGFRSGVVVFATEGFDELWVFPLDKYKGWWCSEWDMRTGKWGK